MAAVKKYPRTRRDKYKETTPDSPTKAAFDEVDGPPEHLPYGFIDVLATSASIVGYLIDVGSDIWLSIVYFTDGDVWWFGLTLAWIISPCVVMTIFSLRLYVIDVKYAATPETSIWHWLIRGIFLAMHLSPIIRYIDSLYYGCRSKFAKHHEQKKSYYEMMLFEDVDSSMLRLFESFMECAPQLVLQIYIMASQGTEREWYRLALQIASVVTSLSSLSWSLLAYHKALRYSRHDKENVSYPDMVLMFFWRFFTIMPRVLAIALFASHYKLVTFAIIGSHWILMTAWLMTYEKKFCKYDCEETCFKFILGVVYIFCYFNIDEGRTRWRYLIFYITTYLENAGLILWWYFVTDKPYTWYHLPALIGTLGVFWVGIAFMVIHYKCCHPMKETIPWCLSTCSEDLERQPHYEVRESNNVATSGNGSITPSGGPATNYETTF